MPVLAVRAAISHHRPLSKARQGPGRGVQETAPWLALNDHAGPIAGSSDLSMGDGWAGSGVLIID
jgi:hypothetical protein